MKDQRFGAYDPRCDIQGRLLETTIQPTFYVERLDRRLIFDVTNSPARQASEHVCPRAQKTSHSRCLAATSFNGYLRTTRKTSSGTFAYKTFTWLGLDGQIMHFCLDTLR